MDILHCTVVLITECVFKKVYLRFLRGVPLERRPLLQGTGRENNELYLISLTKKVRMFN